MSGTCWRLCSFSVHASFMFPVLCPVSHAEEFMLRCLPPPSCRPAATSRSSLRVGPVFLELEPFVFVQLLPALRLSAFVWLFCFVGMYILRLQAASCAWATTTYTHTTIHASVHKGTHRAFSDASQMIWVGTSGLAMSYHAPWVCTYSLALVDDHLSM